MHHVNTQPSSHSHGPPAQRAFTTIQSGRTYIIGIQRPWFHVYCKLFSHGSCQEMLSRDTATRKCWLRISLSIPPMATTFSSSELYVETAVVTGRMCCGRIDGRFHCLGILDRNREKMAGCVRVADVLGPHIVNLVVEGCPYVV